MIESEAKTTIRPLWHQSSKDLVSVTTRRYGEVLPWLMVSESQWLEKPKTIDIGAGFSDTISYLSNTYGLKGMSVDPIYEGIETVDGGANEDLVKYLKGKYPADWIDLNTGYSGTADIYIPEAENRIAADVHTLTNSIPVGSIDLAISNRLMEHINLQLALPEICKTIKPDGEIRFAQCLLSTNTEDGELYSGCIDLHMYDYEYSANVGSLVFTEVNGFTQTMKYLHENGISAFFVETPLTNNLTTQGRKFGLSSIHTGGLLILRKDNKVPKVNWESMNESGQIGNSKIYRIETDKVIKPKDLPPYINGKEDICAYKISEVQI